MNKAFVRETEEDTDDEEILPLALQLPKFSKNYMTPEGWQRMKNELYSLVHKERPKIVDVVNWAASNGDRSENGDYIYGKKRLREIDRRIRFLTKRLEIAEVVDPERREMSEQIYFGATVTIVRGNANVQTLSIVGVDELDPTLGLVSWISPIARALLRAYSGDTVIFNGPEGREEIEIIDVVYQRIKFAD